MSKYSIIIADHLAEEGYDLLRADPDVTFDLRPGIKNDELKTLLCNYDAVITRSGTNVTADLLENTGKLKIVGRAGVGLDNVDIEAASKKGLIVMNAPTGNTLAAVELTMGMILAAARKIPAADQSTRSGEWNRKKFMGVQLYNKTLGIIGMGRIGTNVAIRAKAFGMRIMVFDPYIKRKKTDDMGVTLCNTIEEVLKAADVLTLHTPLTTETKGIITRERIAMMKKGSIIVNCARGGLIDDVALCDAVKSGHLFAAATDVFEEEPPTNTPLLSTENLFITPHIGANTHEGQKGVAVIICEQVLNALHGRPYQYAVNTSFERAQLTPDMQSFFDLCENVGKMAAQLTSGKIKDMQIVLAGKRFEADLKERTFDTPFNYHPFTIALVKGCLETISNEAISYIKAPYEAKDTGLNVTESKVPNYDSMTDHIVLNVKTDSGEEIRYSATVYADGVGRITEIGPFHLDLIAQGTYLYFRNHDTPGIIGKVGTLLAENNINIANFELTRIKARGGEAACFVLVDDPITQQVLDELLNIQGIIEAKAIDL
ncbi:MAG: phosphoglycerate dehydrogenase [Deferribacteraceae bacterium]|jgi:D-3-phosphoglycerate dehydrogenase|nr:phosphoglycerate dehydrogenase [Deferribacteraceae bacterium]